MALRFVWYRCNGVTADCCNLWIFGKIIPEVAASCKNITISNFIASVLYGGIIEEVMLRLFTMSLIVFLIWKVFFHTLPKNQKPGGCI